MRPYSNPGVTRSNYISYFPSKWHIWFRELGYEELDIMEYEDGEWAIIQYLRSPVIPAETQWKPVLFGLRNIEISWSFIKRYTEQLDIQKRAYWAELERQEAEIDREFETNEKNALDRAERAAKLVTRNADAMERMAANGPKELDVRMIRRNIPDYKFRKG